MGTRIALDELTKLDKRALEQYFFDNAGYYADAPTFSKYAILVGNTHLRSDDTMDLRKQFEHKVYSRKRAIARWGKKEKR